MNATATNLEGLSLGARGRRWTVIAAGVGIAGILASLVLGFVVGPDPDGLVRSWLVNYAYFLSLGLGGLFFVMVTHITRAGWSVALRRLAEGVAVGIVPMAALVVPVLLGMDRVYEWAQPDHVAHDPLLQHKSPFLNTSFFIARILVYFVFWTALTWYFTRASTRQDVDGQPDTSLDMGRLAAPGIIIFALTTTFAAFDLLMSVSPHWYSTIFGVYYFGGSFLAFVSFTAIAVLLLQRAGFLRNVLNREHFHDLGKLAFAFTVFWAYIGVSQYLLIWYANIPEETLWYQIRQTGPWTWVTILLVVGHFFVPFVLLISRHTKRRPAVLCAIAAWILFMHWVDLYWLVVPASSPDAVPLALTDLTTWIGIGGVFVAAALAFLARHPLIPVRDPRLTESLEFHNG